MRVWRIVLVGAAVAAVSIVTMGAVEIFSIAGHGSMTAGHVGSNALATHATDAQRPRAFLTDPIRPSESRHENSGLSGSEYGWGPVRTVDW
jgi:hypothetical protein